MKIMRFLLENFTHQLQKYGVVSFVMILVFMIRSVINDSPEQQQNSALVLNLGGAIILLIVFMELGFKVKQHLFDSKEVVNQDK